MLDPLTTDALFLIFDLLPLNTLVRFRHTCRAADVLFAQYFGNCLRILLRRFMSDEDHFLQEMETTSTVIGGSAALATVGRWSWVAANLDLYVPHEYFSHLVSYLIQVEGCEPTFEHLRGAFDDHWEDIGCYVMRLRTKYGESIDVVRSPGVSSLQPLALFWSSALMCFVTSTTFCVAYPLLADGCHSLLRPTRMLDYLYPADRLLRLIHKYEDRGLKFRSVALSLQREHDLGADCPGPGSACCSLSLQYFGDKHCVTASHLSLVDPRPIPASTSYLEYFTLAWWAGGQQCSTSCIGHGGVTQPQEHVLASVVLPDRDVK